MAQTTSGTFTGNGANWGDAANWAGGKMPGSNAGDTAVFNAASNSSLANKTISLGEARTIGALNVIGPNGVDLTRSLTIGSAASPTLTFGAASSVITLSGGINLQLAANMVANGNLTINNNSAVLGKISLLGALNAGSNTVTFYNDTSSADILVSGALTAGSLVKNGSGRLVLESSSPASVTGPVNFNNGTLVIGANNVLGTGTLVLGANINEKKINLKGNADQTLSNALDISASNLIVSRDDLGSATVLRTLTFNPATASVSGIGASRTINVSAFTGLAFGANQAFSGGTLVKQGSGVLTLGGAGSTFSVLDIRAGSVVGYLNSASLSIGGGSGVFGSGTIRVDGGSSALEVRGADPGHTLNIIAGANITLSNQATFRLTNATLGLLGGVIDLGGSGIFDYRGNVILGSTSIVNTPAAGFDFAGNVAFHDTQTGIIDDANYRINLTGGGAQTLSRTVAGAVVVSGTLVKSGAGRVTLDDSITNLTLTNRLQLDAGVFDLGNSYLTATVGIGAGDLVFGAGNQFTGVLLYNNTSTGAARLNGLSQTFDDVTIGAGAVARIDLGGGIDTSTALTLNNISFLGATGYLSIYNYQYGANADHVYNGVAIPTNQVWFHGYNPGAIVSGGELFAPTVGGTVGGAPDFLRVEWTGAANTMDTSNYSNWRTVGTNITHQLALPNAPGVVAVLGDLGGSLGGKTVTGANFGVSGSTWTLGKLFMSNNSGATYTVTPGAGVTLVFDSGVEGTPAVLSVNTYSWNQLNGNVRLDSDLRLEGNASFYFYPSITGTHDIIIARTGAHENRFGGSNENWTGNIIVSQGRISRQGANSWGNITSAVLLSGSSNTITFRGGGIRGQANQNKISVPNRIFIEADLSHANNTAFTWNGDVLLNAGIKSFYNMNVDEAVINPAGQRASLTFSASTNLVGDAGLSKSGVNPMEILSGNNTFSGGLRVTAGVLHTTVGAGGLVIGHMDAGKNYLGSGSISVTSGTLQVDTQGYETLVSGTGGDKAIINLGSTHISFNEGGLVTLGTDSQVVGNNNDNSQFRVSGSLKLDGGIFGDDGVTTGKNVNLYLDTTTNPGGGGVGKGSNGAGVVKGLRNIVKAGSGMMNMDSQLAFNISGNLLLDGGVLQLGANNQVTGANGISLVNVNLNGGALGVEGTSQSFNNLNLLASGGSLLLGDNGGITFAGAGAWTSSALLSVQNTSGIWNTNNLGAYIRFTSTSGLTSLNNISLTGYESGVTLTQGADNYWYLTASAPATIEWTGGDSDVNALWGNADNWLTPVAPDGVDLSVSIKDIDENLATKTIDVNGNYTLSRLNVTSVQTAVTLGGSGTLVFERTGTGAASRILHDGGSILTIGSAVQLKNDIELAANTLSSVSYLKWTGSVGGSGGITKTGAGTLLLMNKDSDYTGGFTWRDSSVIQLGGANAASYGGAYFGSGTFVIGDGTNKNFYLETYNEQLASSNTVIQASTTRFINGDFILRGNLIHQRQTDLGQLVTNGQYGEVSRIVFNGNGVFDDPSGTGVTYIINNYAQATTAAGDYTTTVFNGNITGSANIHQTGYGFVYYNGDNSGYTGNYTLAGKAVIKKDNAFGTGTLTLSGGINVGRIQVSSGKIMLSNVLNIGAGTNYQGDLVFNLDSGATGQKSTVTGIQGLGGSGVLTFGKDHVIAGAGGFVTGAESGWGRSGIIRFLGANEFSSNINHQSATIHIGRDSLWDSGTLVSGALGIGTLNIIRNTAVIGAYVGADSINPDATSIRMSNAVNFGANGITVTNAGSATTLIFDTGSISLRNGKSDLSINVTTANQVLSIESLLADKDGSTAGGITKTGAGILELLNTNNQISDGIDVQAGVVRTTVVGDNVQVGSHAVGDSAFGTGVWRTQTASGAGTAGAFEVAALTASATVTLTGSNSFVLNDNGRLRITGTDVSTVLADNGWLASSDTVGQEGVLVADNIFTQNYTLGVKLNALNWTLNAGTVNLARANLLADVQNIYLTQNSTLDINQLTQTINGTIYVTGSAYIDVSGGSAHNPVSILTGTISVNSTDSLLTFLGWDADPITGLGSTLIRTSLTEGTIINGVVLGGNSATSVVAQRNDEGIRVLLPFDDIFIWDGATNNVWANNNWMKQDGLHLPDAQPNIKGAQVTFNTDLANLAGATITLSGDRRLNNLLLVGASDEDFTIAGPGNLVFQGRTASASGFITQTGVSDVTIGTNILLEYDATDLLGKNLSIEQNGAGWLIFNGKIEGPDSIVTVSGTGAGAVVFNAANMFSKGFVVESGEVHIGADRLNTGDGGPLGVGAIMVVGGTLRATDGAGNDANRTLVNDIVFAGDLTVAGTGALSITGEGTIAEDATVTVTEASGTFVLGSEGETLSGTNNLVFEGDGKTVVVSELNLAEVTVSGSLTELDGVISGTTKIIKTGTGTLLLLAENTHSGGVAMQGGITGINNNSALGTGTAMLDSGTLRLDANNLSLANNFALASTGEVNTQTHTGTLTGVISGAGNIAKAGTGVLTLTNAANTHSGTMLVRTGTLALAANNAAGASTIHVDSAARVNLSYTGSLANTVSGAGVAEVTGTVLVTGGAANDDFSGTWAVNDTMRIAESNAAGAASNIALAGLLQTTGTANITLSNTLTGGGTVQFAGSGTHKLGANMGTAFTGQVDANQGAFTWDANASAVLANNATLRTTGGWTDIAAGAQTANTLAIAGGTLAFTGTATVATLTIDAPASVLMDQGKLTAPGILRQDEARSETLVAASNNTWGANLSNLGLVNSAGASLGATSTLAIQAGAINAIYSNSLAQNGNNLELRYGLDELVLQLGRTGTLSGDDGSPEGSELHALVSGSGSLEIIAGNMITLSSSATYTGTTTTTSGTFLLGAADAIYTSALLVNNAVLDTGTNAQSLRALQGSGTARLTRALTVESGSYAGVFDGAANLEKTTDATLTLSGSSAHSGTTLVTAGILRATNAGAFGASELAVNATGTTELSGFNGAVSSALSGSGELRVVDNAAVNYTGNASAWSGLARVDSGRLYVNNAFGSAASRLNVYSGGTLSGTGAITGYVHINGGVLAPGNSPGLTAITGTLQLTDATLEYDLDANTNPGHIDQVAAGNNDRTDVTGDVILVGTSTLNILGSVARGEYDLIKYTGALTGDASNLAMGTLNNAAVTDPAKYLFDTDEDGYVKLLYDFGYFTYWDGGTGTNWSNGKIDGGSGTWFASSGSAVYLPWTRNDSGVPNGEWLDAGFAIFKGTAGTVTVDNTSGSGTIAFSGAQFRTDGYLLTGGTLTTGGTAAVVLNTDLNVSATIATQITGTHNVNKDGTGTLVLSGSNTHTGTTGVLAGTLVMANEHALGANTVNLAANATLRVATGSMTFANALTGSGLFEVDLANATDVFAFAATTGTAFTGTASFNNSAYLLNNNTLANATAKLNAGNTTTVATGTQHIGNLTASGGALGFTYATGTQADGIIRTGAFDAISGTVTVSNTNPSTGTTGLFASTLLQQDEGLSVRLLNATTVSNTNLTLAGGATTTADIRDGVVTTATATYTQALNYTGGLAVDYALTQLDLVANQTTTLSGDVATPAGGAELHAQITGAGNLAINATNAITLNNAANTYTGTTFITSGTLISGTSNALGQTSYLSYGTQGSYDLSSHTQTIGGGNIAGNLLGTTGSLGLGGIVSITSTNAAFAASVGVTGTTTINNTQALGNSGTANVTGELVLDSATGALAKQVAGTGTVSLINTSSVALTGANTLSGEWNIAQDTALRASSTANLGAADITANGLITIANAADETLANNLSGSGTFAKENTGNLTISHSNAFTGATQIDSGTLTLTDLGGVGTSTVANNAILDLAGTGTFANTISGTGVNLVTGSVSLRGTNTAFSGTLHITGTADITDNDQIGASTAQAVIASNAKLATSATSFIHELTGPGQLAVDTANKTFGFAASAGNAFSGTVSLANTTMHLGTNAAHTNNAWALANSTLQLLGGSTLATNSETRTLGGLDLGGGAISIPMDGTHPHEVLQTGTLTVTNPSDSKIIFEGYTGTTPVISSTVHVNFLDEDGPTSTAVLLVATGTLVDGHENLHIDVVKEDGSPLADGQLVDYDNVIATYNYTGITVSRSTAFTHIGSATAGIYYDYVLTQIDVKSGTHAWLDATSANDNTFSANITGAGGVVYTTGSTLIITGSNSYYGSSTITTGTLIAGVDNALGNTSRLDINSTAALDLGGHKQTITNGAQIDGGLYNSHTHAAITGSLGLGGLVSITSTNAGFAANVGVTGTTTINNTQALGNSGTANVTGELVLDSATGTLAKQVAGTGTVSLIASSSVALTGTNTLSGEWNIAQDTALRASSTANLGLADILLDGLLSFENAADETLANNLSGSGTFAKENTGNLTISHSNAFAGATQIDSGTLTLADLGGVGTSTVANNAILDLAGTGTFANTISGTGVNLVSGSVSLRGTNTAFTGTLRVTGTADITDNDQVGGATAHTVIASNAKLATTATSFIHDLTGDGILAINSVSGTFDFMATTGSAFAGTVTLDATALTLNTNHNTEALASATLQLNTGGILHSNGETRRIHGLTLNGGALWLPMNGVDPVEVLNVGTLSIADLGSTVVFENYTGGTTAIIDSTVQKNWLDQDNLTDNATLLVAADTLAEAAPRQIAIYKADGTALSNGQTIEHDEVYAIYNYTAQTTGSASAHTSGSLAPGLYYDYVLTELNVKQDKTLQLTDAGATDDTLSAAITGDGSVTFTTGSAMTLTGSNTYTGTSTLISGTVVAGVDNALGSTKLILVEIPATFDLNGKAQTIAEGGRIDGHLAGTGTLTLASGTLAINSANADYSAQTNIGAPATVHATDAGALGTSHVQLDGVLKVDATGTMQNTLAGSGQFHASSGDITLVNSSASFHGTGTVTSGRLTATEIDALGDAPIGVAAGAGFEQLNVTGTLQNALSGEGTHLVTNSTLRLNDPLNYTIASTTLDSNSALILEATGYAFGTLNMNNGVLAFANLADRARIATLGASTGNIVMNADLSALSEGINNAATIANYLDIANAGAGTHNVFIETNGTLPSALNASIELIGVDAASSATFTLANNAAGKLEYDLTVFELVRGDLSDYTPNANMWYLSDRNLSHAADAIINTASTLAIDWNYSLDSIHQRLGDIRLGLEHASLGSVWIKSRGYRLNATNELSGMSFRQYGWGVTGGADKSFGTQTGVSLLGGFIDAGGINREFDNNGNGHTTNVGIGAYLTLIKNNGWFADITARADRYSNRFEARSYDGTTTKGRYNNNALGLSLEAGRRLQRTDGWWIEPTVQMSVLWLDGASYTTEANATHRAMKVKINDSMNTQYRALLRFGRQIKDSRWHPYGKLAGVAVDSDRGAIKAHGKTFRTDYDGRRVEFGLGTSYRIDTASQLYIDYEYAKAQAYERPWSINLGYRRLW
ncbi:autotransporter-associated beta strand repeat-containing protein [Ereboglobus luteus]|uniref:autotransporter-associated beta strand repeat-containing protein n=1 Tax=Ereboglobus luteus TaxID=1796921 RepID=UPI0013749E14|nr:autotransporter-associated beta strand repeat-containing protein [Ereboglobus luteus]